MSPASKGAVFLERRVYRQRRMRDAARMLPVLGVVLWFIPMLWQTAGVEAMRNATAVQYVFAVWVLMIVLTAVVSRRVATDPAAPEADAGGGKNA